jgi:Putative beta-barrel porin 2
MRISSVALSTLTALIAWETHPPAQATVPSPSPSSPVTDQGSLDRGTGVAPTLVSGVAMPEAIAPPEFSPASGTADLASESQGSTAVVTGRPEPLTMRLQLTTIEQPVSSIVPLASVAASPVTGSPIARADRQGTPLPVPAATDQPGETSGAAPDESLALQLDHEDVSVHPVGFADSVEAATNPPIASAAPDPSLPRLPALMLAQTPPVDPTTAPTDRFPSDETPTPLDAEDVQSELGEIRILNRPPQASPPRRQPDVQLLLRSGVFTSSNTTSLKAFQPSDTIFINQALLLATPKLGPNTRLLTSVGGGLLRFANQGDANYNSLSFNVALQQRVAPGTYGQLGWTQDNLYRAEGGQRVLRDNSLQFLLGRQDQLGKRFRLDSFYELKASFTNPDEQSRLANTLGARLRYDVTPKLQGALDYRITFKDFTQVDWADTEHQISALAIYNITPDWFVAGSVSYLFGRSSNPTVDLSNLAIGVSLGLNLPLF